VRTTITSSTRTRLATALAATVLVATMAACGQNDGTEVASASKQPSTTSTPSSSAHAAEDFARCLTEAGVDASVTPEGTVSLGDPNSPPSIKGDTSGGIAEITVDGVDVTSQYNDCLAQVPDYDPFDEPEENEADVAAKNEAAQKWVDCARKNGLPTLEDPVKGSVVLDESVTGDAMTSTLKACPLEKDSFDIFFAGQPDQAVLDALMARES
jgi:hypothetical protein